MKSLEQARKEINEIDRQMRALFLARMQAVESVAAYKREQGMPVLDASREAQVIEQNTAGVDDGIRPYYTDFLKATMGISRAYQQERLGSIPADLSHLRMHLGEESYDILIQKGILERARELLKLDRRVLVVTDSGVPAAYAARLAEQCDTPVCLTLPQGEESKCEENLHLLWSTMLDAGFTRGDCVVAVGGGVVGDLAGFCASTYMRGIDFYNIPTTLLSQVDSSIGGKTAIDFGGMKNIVGAFHQPRRVLIDPALLSTLDSRQYASGLAEVIKMAATCDAELFSLMEEGLYRKDPETMILRALLIKKQVVEADQREGGLRRVLNFGHTLGHGIEAEAGGKLLHGECVALGMLAMCAPPAKERLHSLLTRVGLPTAVTGDAETILAALCHDKKATGAHIWTVTVPEIGSFSMEKRPMEQYIDQMRSHLTKGEV